MNKSLDNVDDSYSELLQEDVDVLYRVPAIKRSLDQPRGFVEDLEARVDATLAAEEEAENLTDLLITEDYEFDAQDEDNDDY